MNKILEVPSIVRGDCPDITCLAMVLQYLDRKTNVEYLLTCFKDPYKVKSNGAKRKEFLEVARCFGVEARPYHKLGVDGLMRLIDLGFPVITNTRWHEDSRLNHNYVVKGYDQVRKFLYVNDPATSMAGFGFDRFEKMWNTGFFGTKGYGVVLRDGKKSVEDKCGEDKCGEDKCGCGHEH